MGVAYIENKQESCKESAQVSRTLASWGNFSNRLIIHGLQQGAQTNIHMSQLLAFSSNRGMFGMLFNVIASVAF